ncbi:MAG: TGS domain-containing protein [Dehalococcoidia bacterium]|nr:TGS domain-containing protein [Dehalococcoidia bacterium]
MPANLTPQYFEAERAYKQAKTAPERIEALENMLAIMPKHKGTDKLRADLRTRIAKLHEEEEQQRQKGGARAQLHQIRREGAGQVVLVGLPNSGKSQLLASLTDAMPTVADYPLTTQLPLPGMMRYKDAQVQIVDIPAVTCDDARSWVRNILRSADLLLLVVDLGRSFGEQMETLREKLAGMRILLLGRQYTLPEAPDIGKRTVVVANKSDLKDAVGYYLDLESWCADDFPLVLVSAADGFGLDGLKKEIFQALDVVRVYTKAPGRKADQETPFVIKHGSTVEDLAEFIHKDLRRDLKYAQVWGSSKFDGQRVNRNYVLEDGDIVELHR